MTKKDHQKFGRWKDIFREKKSHGKVSVAKFFLESRAEMLHCLRGWTPLAP